MEQRHKISVNVSDRERHSQAMIEGAKLPTLFDLELPETLVILYNFNHLGDD